MGSPNVKTDYVDYLTSYEHMVRSQDGSFDATVIHLRTNIVGRLHSLDLLPRGTTPGTPCADSIPGSRDSFGSCSSSLASGGVASRGVMITYTNMKQCLQRLNYGTNNNTDHDKMIGLLATDTQLVMLLTLLVESYTEYTTKTSFASSSSSPTATTRCDGNTTTAIDIQASADGLCLPEFIQAYDIIVSGMQCLQQHSGTATTTTTPPSSAAAAATAATTAMTTVKSDDDSSISSITSMNNTNNIVLQRIKERTMEMIRAFGNPTLSFTTTTTSKLLLLLPNNNSTSFLSPSTAASAGGRRRGRMSSSSSPSNSAKKMFTNDEITTVMHTKDSTLTRIIEEHESEMEALVSSITELQGMERRMKVLHRKRKLRLWLFGVIYIASLVIIVTIIEIRHQSYRTNQVAISNTNERSSATTITLQTITELQHQKSHLENSLHLVQGKIRFETGRTDNILNHDIIDIQTQINNTNSKWYKDMIDIEQCYSTCDEMNENLQIERSLMSNIEEELTWCTGRLTSRVAIALSNVGVGNDITTTAKQRQHQQDDGSIALLIQGGGGGGVGNTIINAAKAIMIHTNNNDSDINRDDNDRRPVYLEMKYSISIRRAMILRQGYSIMAGLGTSVIVQWLLKVLVFGPTGAAVTTATTAAAAATASAITGPGVEMIVVDGIFGSSIGFLILRALAMFILP